MATHQNRVCVENPAFRLIFLRANLRDAGESAHQMLDFLQHKAKYFGNEKVARDITLDDLNEGDMALLLSGLLHIQEGRVRRGRVIVYLFSGLHGIGTIQNHIRASYYFMFNILAQIREVQKEGIVNCYYGISKPGDKIRKFGLNCMTTIIKFLNAAPIRTTSQHTCLKDDKDSNVALNKFILGISYLTNSSRQISRLELESTTVQIWNSNISSNHTESQYIHSLSMHMEICGGEKVRVLGSSNIGIKPWKVRTRQCRQQMHIRTGTTG
ncbi:unnamed protein product [Cylindrotheca closterium]|uniref:Uncharacterized protein n=1 Tax=Cylindrotheca closterium TaxID=2856 RepID=A0AAD2G722_9STRA|nr:unnamed protein product [Cylindrotheca closterium]